MRRFIETHRRGARRAERVGLACAFVSLLVVAASATPIDVSILDHRFEDHSLDAIHRAEDLGGGLDFSFATFTGSDLRATAFTLDVLEGTIFAGADLRGADFGGAWLKDADLSGADLRTPTNFAGAFLGGADLTGITSNGATLFAGALYNDGTSFDAGFDPVAEGMILVPEPSTAALLLFGGVIALGRRRLR